MIKYFLAIIFIYSGLYAQNFRLGASVGMNAGVPMPEKIDRKTEDGLPGIGPMIGASLKYIASNHWSFEGEIRYEQKAATYSKNYRRDTTVEVILRGVKGYIPTFYTADVHAKMRLHYISLPILAQYSIKNFAFVAGPQLSYLVAGRDAGDAHVVVGEGGVYEDINRNFNNIKEINKLDFSISAGFNVNLSERLRMQVKVNRSLRSMYRKNFLKEQGHKEQNICLTYLQLGLNYELKGMYSLF